VVRPNNVVIDKDARETQMMRALDLWTKVTTCPGIQIEQNVVERMKESLSIGAVPPVFHAYSLRYKRWLDIQKGRDDEKDDDVLLFKLSNIATKEVTAGEAREYQGNYFINYNDGGGVDEFMSVLFDDKEKVARLNVGELKLSWTFNPTLTTKVCQLVNARAEMVGEDVEVTPVDSDFKIGCVRHCSKAHLITRRLSRGVVANCFSDFIPEDTRYIVGNPGIGKSWTLIYALQQALLYDGACVLFFVTRGRFPLLCVRRYDKIFVWQSLTVPEKVDSALFTFTNVLVLLDPEPDGTKFFGGARRLICAASNNKKHFDKAHLDVSEAPMRYLNPLTEEEVCAALPNMMEPGQFNKDAILERARQIGFFPRWLLMSEKRRRNGLMRTQARS
jgi:hypothetical protein